MLSLVPLAVQEKSADLLQSCLSSAVLFFSGQLHRAGSFSARRGPEALAMDQGLIVSKEVV